MKLGESFRKLHDFVVVCSRVASKADVDFEETSKEYRVWKSNILFYEEIVLEALCFDLDIVIPHPSLLVCAKAFELSPAFVQQACKNIAYSLKLDLACNRAMDTTLPLQFNPKRIALACIYLVHKTGAEKVPQEKWKTVDMDPKTLESVSERIRSVEDEKRFMAFHESMYKKKESRKKVKKEHAKPDVDEAHTVDEASEFSDRGKGSQSPWTPSTPVIGSAGLGSHMPK